MSARLEQTADKTRGELRRGERDTKMKEVRQEEMEEGELNLGTMASKINELERK